MRLTANKDKKENTNVAKGQTTVAKGYKRTTCNKSIFS